MICWNNYFLMNRFQWFIMNIWRTPRTCLWVFQQTCNLITCHIRGARTHPTISHTAQGMKFPPQTVMATSSLFIAQTALLCLAMTLWMGQYCDFSGLTCFLCVQVYLIMWNCCSRFNSYVYIFLLFNSLITCKYLFRFSHICVQLYLTCYVQHLLFKLFHVFTFWIFNFPAL